MHVGTAQYGILEMQNNFVDVNRFCKVCLSRECIVFYNARRDIHVCGGWLFSVELLNNLKLEPNVTV